MERRRWDIDESFTGIASGEALLPGVQDLAAHMRRAGWTAEDPDAHLLPHLEKVCSEDGSPWRNVRARLVDGGVYEVEVDHAGGEAGDQMLIRDAMRLLSVVAESSFHVRQVDPTTIECVTGTLDGDGSYASHGHLIRLRVHH